MKTFGLLLTALALLTFGGSSPPVAQRVAHSDSPLLVQKDKKGKDKKDDKGKKGKDKKGEEDEEELCPRSLDPFA
ncbi:MAG: hypothetical protein ACOZIN_06165 [Myxococcota bacterium]